MELVAVIVETSDLVSEVLLLVQIRSGLSKLSGVGLCHWVANIVYEVRRHFCARHFRLAEVVRLLSLKTLKQSIGVGHGINRARFVELTGLLKVLILVVGFHLGGSFNVIFGKGESLVRGMALL